MKPLARTLLRTVAALPAAVCWIAYAVSAAVLGRDTAFESASQWLSLWPGRGGVLVRSVFFGWTANRCEATAQVGFGALLSKPGIEIGRHAYIGPRCCLGLVTLEDDVLLGPGVQIPSGGGIHRFDRLDTPIRNQPGQVTRVRIGRGAWIGAGAVIMADVGEDTVVGAGAVVTRPLPPRVVAAGVPAEIVRERRHHDPLPAPAAPGVPHAAVPLATSPTPNC